MKPCEAACLTTRQTPRFLHEDPHSQGIQTASKEKERIISQVIDRTDLSKTAGQAGYRALERTALRATLWTLLAYGASQALRMCSSIILTRLLLPEFFGLMTLVYTIIMGLTLLSDVGLLPSVIGSSRGDDPVFLNTAWTVQIVRGLCLWVMAALIAHPLALFYHDARLNLIIPVVSLTTIISGFSGTSLLTAARHIGVHRIYIIDLISQLLAMLATVVWAHFSPTIWSLVAGALVGALLKMTLSHAAFIMPGHRNSFAWEEQSLQSLVHFGKWIMVGTAFFFFASQADRIILGKLITFKELGIYGVAFTIADIPRQVIIQFASRVGFPFVAKLTDLPRADFNKTILKYRFYCLAVGAMMLSVVIIMGPLFIRAVYDIRYREAVWMIPILSLGLWHTLLYSTTGTILFSLKKPKYNAVGTACYCATMFIALPLAYHFAGLFGAVISVAAGDIPFYVVLEFGAAREKISVWRQDALATLLFLAILGSGLAVRHLFK